LEYPEWSTFWCFVSKSINAKLFQIHRTINWMNSSMETGSEWN
jgi:hypothetical protein